MMNEETNKAVYELLMTVVGERGDNEGAVDVATRLIRESRMHDELVTALEAADKALAKYSYHSAYLEDEFIQLIENNYKVLTKAKGGQPDGSIDKDDGTEE